MTRDAAFVAGARDVQPVATPHSASRRIRRAAAVVAQALIIGLLVVLPWLFGGVHLWVQAWALLALVVCVGCWSCRQVGRRETHVYLPWAMVPLLLALGLGAIQLIPLRAETLERVSPQASAFRQSLSGQPVPLGGELNQLHDVPTDPERWPISLYPAGTRRELAALTLAILSFVAGAHFFRKAKAQFVLLVVVAVNGAAVGFFGIVQQLRWNGMLYWTIPLRFGGMPFGPFVNRNNAAGYLNLALGAALGVAIYSVAQYRYKPATFGKTDRPPESTRLQKIKRVVTDHNPLELVGNLSATSLAVMTLVGVLIAAVFSSLSRGGIMAMLVAGAVTAALVLAATRLRRVIWPLLIAASIGVALITWLGVTTDLRARVGQVFDAGGRLDHWSSSLRAVGDFWFCGSGLGAYSYTYRPFLEKNASSWHPHAENQYLEALLTGGVPGLLLLVAALAAVAMALRQVWRHRNGVGDLALATTGLFVLISQALQAGVDFGLYLGANLVTTGVILGAVCGRAALLAREDADRGPPRRWAALRVPLSLGTLLVAILAAVGVLAWREMRAAGAVESAVLDATAPPDWQVSEKEVELAIARLETAVAQQPDDAIGHLRLVEMWNRLYQHRAARLMRGEMPSRDQHEVWRLADPAQLHAQAAKYAQAGHPELVEQIRAQPVVRQHLPTAWRHALAARRATPMIPEVHLELAMLCFLAGDPLADSEHLERMLQAAPAESRFFYTAGIMDLDAQRSQPALARLKRSWELDGLLHEDILTAVAGRFSAQEVIDGLLPHAPTALIEAARSRAYADPSSQVDRLALATEAERLLPSANLSEADRENVLGAIFQMRGEWPAAIQHQRRAVELRPELVAWRYDLARLLAQAGEFQAAFAEASRCVALEPGNTYYRLLQANLAQHRRK